MSKFLTSGGTESMRDIRARAAKKWDSLGFLDGLKGHVKENIAKLYECEASTLLNESRTKDDFPVMPIVKRFLDKIPDGVPLVATTDANQWSVYMVECSDGTIYTGISNDVSKRILAHNAGKGAKYTKPRLPVALKWLQECDNRSEASKAEYKIKRLSRKEKLKKIRLYHTSTIAVTVGQAALII